ncbi:DNA repair protein [Gemelliphila palaticanis]|uniref:DNA repair protein n=1 Tax=Gemelliphila palaticanis TaxID=81950 RepID=A0ABX2T151_9BACL|nr:DNA repair protein [Gemella palaticanis]MBF0715981.1 DNA repair protein [Gemella palaticanis]NYS47911.1 DNA repair protein [Gemella palaticanis]
MSHWDQFLTEITNSIIQNHKAQKSLSLYVPFEDSLSKALAFDNISQELSQIVINGNGTELYSDFGDNDITDKYKLSFKEKFLKPISMSINHSIPGFGTAGISLKYDSAEIEKKILNNSNSYRLIFLIQHWEWLGNELKLFFIRLINNISSYEKKYNKSIIIVVGGMELKNSDINFSKNFDIHHFELNDLKDTLGSILQNSSISDDLVDTLYPLTKGNLEKIYNFISLSHHNSKIEKLLDDLLNKIETDFRENKIDIDFIYQLSVLPEYFNPYDAEEYFNLKTFQIEKAIDILKKLLVLIPVKNRTNFYSLILIMKDKLLLTVEKGQKEIYRRYYYYLCVKDPFNYRLKIEILAKLKESQEDLLSLYLLWYEHLLNQNDNLKSEKNSLYRLEFLVDENKSKFFKCIKYQYKDDTNSLYKEILPESSLLSSILLKNDINFQGNTSQSFSFHSLCDTLYENILSESSKDVIIEPIHYLSCIYMLLPHLIDKLNEIDKFQVLNENIVKKFYITKDIEQSAQYLKNIYLRKSFLYKDNDRSINDANRALKFFIDVDDKIEQYYTLGSLLGLLLVSSDYDQANQVKQEIESLSAEHKLPLYWKSKNNFVLLDFFSEVKGDFDYWKSQFESIITEYEVNDVSKHLIYTNLCSISLYYSKTKEYRDYKKILEELMGVEDLADLDDASIDDFYRYYFGWFEFCLLLLENKYQQAKNKYNQLEGFYPVIFESDKKLLVEKHRRYKKIFELNVKTGKEFSEFLSQSKFSSREWNYFRRGLMLTDIQYTSAL